MFKFKNNRVFVAVFAILLALSVVAIYIPLLLPPSSEQSTPTENQSNFSFQTTTLATSSPSSSVPNEKSLLPSTSTKNIPPSLQGLENDENSLNNIQKNLIK